MKVLIETITTPNVWHLSGATAKLRIYADQTFQTSLGQWIPQGTPGKANSFYLEVACTITAGELSIPTFEVDSTVDALINPHATYTAEIVSANNTRVPFLANFAVNTLPDGDPSATWAEITILRNMFVPQSLSDNLSRQISGMISAAVGQLNRASETNTGVTALDTDPVDPIFPIAIGANNPDFQSLIQTKGTWLRGYDATAHGVVGDGVTDDRAALHQLMSVTVPGAGADIFLPAGTYLVNSALTVPSGIRLWFARGAMFKPANGVKITILGSIFDTPYQTFTNISAGQGIISFAGNSVLRELRARWWGVSGDGVTDFNAILQRITDQLDEDNFSGTLILPTGEVILNGPLHDVGGANAQWTLPARTIADGQLSLRIIGERPLTSLTGTPGTGGTILRSTLGAGNGAMIGCKTTDTFGSSQLNLWLEDITFQMPVNPTNTCLDLRFIKRVFMDGFKIWQGESSNWTQPTNAGSFGLRTPTDNVVSDCAIRNGVISGFYENLEANEWCRMDNIQVGPGEYGYTFTGNHYPVTAGIIGAFFCRHTVRFTGPATVDISCLGIERSSEVGKWYSFANLVNDFSETTAGDAHGRIGFLVSNGLTGQVEDNSFVVGPVGGTNGKNIRLYSLHDNSYVYNYIDPTGTLNLANPAVFELNAKRATAGETDYSLMILGAEQNGPNNTTSILAFENSALAAAEKRIAQIGVGTAGATNSGIMNFSIWNAGVLNVPFSIRRNGIAILGVPVFADNAAAIAGGLALGMPYRLGGDPDHLCIVH